MSRNLGPDGERALPKDHGQGHGGAGQGRDVGTYGLEDLALASRREGFKFFNSTLFLELLKKRTVRRGCCIRSFLSAEVITIERDNQSKEKRPMKMKPTQGVSYPRSGHAPVFHIAKRYFGDALIYCDPKKKKHCGCGSVPCSNPARTFSKNHDFGLHRSVGVPIIPSEHYFIQYRNPVRSIVSNFYLHRNNHPDMAKWADWETFARRCISHWNRFVDKWVLDFPSDADAPFYCGYETLIADPETRVREILSFLSDEPLDDEAVARILEQHPIAPRDRLSAFEFYDPIFFKELEDVTAERLARLELPSFAEEI